MFLSRNITNDPEVLAQIPRLVRTRGGGQDGEGTHMLELETPAGQGSESREQPRVLCQEPCTPAMIRHLGGDG